MALKLTQTCPARALCQVCQVLARCQDDEKGVWANEFGTGNSRCSKGRLPVECCKAPGQLLLPAILEVQGHLQVLWPTEKTSTCTTPARLRAQTLSPNGWCMRYVSKQDGLTMRETEENHDPIPGSCPREPFRRCARCRFNGSKHGGFPWPQPKSVQWYDLFCIAASAVLFLFMRRNSPPAAAKRGKHLKDDTRRGIASHILLVQFGQVRLR